MCTGLNDHPLLSFNSQKEGISLEAGTLVIGAGLVIVTVTRNSQLYE
jgi:hypothetical protein